MLTVSRVSQHDEISRYGSDESSNLPNSKGDVLAEDHQNGIVTYTDPSARIMDCAAIREAMDACKTIKRKPIGTSDPVVQRCPVSHKTTNHEDMEHDFTTPGVIGNLQCPFARMVENGVQPVLANGTVDPIAAEFHPDKISINSVPPSAQAPGICPIRFLDQHSPEEVAKYFENHKHEIPRSHEICVKRYQQNERSIRQLDAKYGNLVNMIQGLGVKHKQYLPGDTQNEPLRKEQGSVETVEKWADGHSHKSLDPVVEPLPREGGMAEEEERKPRFERSLREIRVGESPSRPWGIFVPAAQKPSQSAILSDRQSEPVDLARSDISVPKSVQGKSARKCPADHGLNNALPNNAGAQKSRDESGKKTAGKEDSSPPHIVFNGPVFFGYSAEKAAALLQSVDLGNGHQ